MYPLTSVPKTAQLNNIMPKTLDRQPVNYLGISLLLVSIEENCAEQTFLKDIIAHNENLLYQTELEMSVLYNDFLDNSTNNDTVLNRLWIKRNLIHKELERLNNSLLTAQVELHSLVSLFTQKYKLGGVAQWEV